jgi:predicted nucleotidyltransferase
MLQSKLKFPIESIQSLCRRYRVRELSVFGSALREDFKTDSDVDLLVEFEPDAQIGFISLSRMQRELSAILQRPVDLVPKGGLKPTIRQEVLSTAEVIYAA